LAVLEALHKHPHSDAATIFGVVHGTIKTTSKQAIYNNLNTLVERGIVREIRPKGQPSLYETKVGVCRDGRIALIYADNTLCNISVNDENCSCRADAESLINENLNGNCVGTTVPFWGYYNSGY
jgi:Fur family ferric uptake transcriptional regulator